MYRVQRIRPPAPTLTTRSVISPRPQAPKPSHIGAALAPTALNGCNLQPRSLFSRGRRLVHFSSPNDTSQRTEDKSDDWNFFVEMSKSLAKKLIDEVWTMGEIGLLGDLLTPDHLYKDSCWANLKLKGRAALSNFVQDMRVAYPDLRFTIRETMHRMGTAPGEATLIVYWACQGTQTGEFLGMAASGRVEAFNGVHVLTVDLASGRIKATDVFRECAPTEELYKRNVSWNAED